MADANQFFRYVDGVLKSFTSSSYLSTFGEVPTHPRHGERIFGGRYENKTFYTASSAFPHAEDGFHDSLRNVVSGSDYNLSGSYNIGPIGG